MTLDELLVEWSYRTEKGYPNMDNPSDILILGNILNELNIPSDFIISKLKGQKTIIEQEETFTKQDLINLINKTDISDQQLLDLSKRISKLYLTGPINSYLDKKAQESNIPQGQILKFKELLKEEDIQKEFAEYIKNPSSLDLSKTSFTDQISNISSDKILKLYREMGSAIVGNVSIGPGEILFSIFFNNVFKIRISEGLSKSG